MKDTSTALGAEWQDSRKKIFTPEELRKSELKTAIVGELIEAREQKQLSQKRLEELSGVKQPVIARMESGRTNPRLDTILKILAPLGKTLAVVPIGK